MLASQTHGIGGAGGNERKEEQHLDGKKIVEPKAHCEDVTMVVQHGRMASS